MTDAMCHTQRQDDWQEWPTPSYAYRHIGQYVEVMNARSHVIVLRGEVVGYTDLLGSGGILEYGPYGQDTSGNSLTAAIKFPKNTQDFSAWTKRFRFRISSITRNTPR